MKRLKFYLTEVNSDSDVPHSSINFNLSTLSYKRKEKGEVGAHRLGKKMELHAITYNH